MTKLIGIAMVATNDRGLTMVCGGVVLAERVRKRERERENERRWLWTTTAAVRVA